MEIRKATQQDTPEIVELLRTSLGESLMPKSDLYWNWKHVDNTFGESPVFLAVEKGEIIGVRAFMTWEWLNGDQRLKAIRAVDTATHPQHQGKGIFKKLTLSLLEQCKNQGVGLVFNTPNNKSKPGYLKMGWEEAGKLPVKVGFKKPLNIAVNRIFRASQTEFIPIDSMKYDVRSAIDQYKGSLKYQQTVFTTAYSSEYLKWRYVNVPIIEYGGLSCADALVIFRLKRGALGVELRICDAFGAESEVGRLIKEVYEQLTFDYITIGGFAACKLPSLLRKTLQIGPEVTVKSVNHSTEEFLNFNKWFPSLGDLEVF